MSRQAFTLRILDMYIREGAPVLVALSADCRTAVLKSRASSAFIFGRARAEMLEMMQRGKKTPVRARESERQKKNTTSFC